MKGEKLHMTDLVMHLHYIVDFHSNKCIIYSDILNQAVSFDPATFRRLFGTWDNSSEFYTVDLKPGESVEYKGDLCLTASDQPKYRYAGSQTIATVNLLYSDSIAMPDVYKYALFGLKSPGLVRKWCWAVHSPEGIIGEMNSFCSYELVATEIYQPSDSEFELPEEVTMSKDNGIKGYLSLLKNNTKALKKSKIYPEGKANVRYDIASEWDFVADWEKRMEENNSYKSQWSNFGLNLLGKTLTLASSIASDLQSAPSNGHSDITTDGEHRGNSHAHNHKSGSSKDCNLCHGTGICTYCNGSGFNYSGGTPYMCNGCKTNKGVGERCHGKGVR